MLLFYYPPSVLVGSDLLPTGARRSPLVDQRLGVARNVIGAQDCGALFDRTSCVVLKPGDIAVAGARCFGRTVER